MDLVDLIAEKYFIGQEFLTWLWCKSEENGGTINIPALGKVVVVYEKHMVLEFGEGEAHEKLTTKGLQTELHEAKAGLAMGKKVEQARLQIVSGDYEYHMTLRGSLFDYSGVKLPKTMAGHEDGDGAAAIEGRLLDRIGLHESAIRIIDELFRLFIAIRVSGEWEKEVAAVRSWIHQEAA